MNETIPAVTTKAALLRVADAFGELWNKGRDVLGALDELEASIVEREQYRASLDQQIAVLREETERLKEPFAVLAELRKDLGIRTR
jgi:chromosome segregation ATPase